MKAWGGLTILVCALAVLALPAGAAAKPGYYVEKPTRLVFLELQGSNGFRAFLFGYNRHQVSISVSDELGAATYSVRGKVTSDEITARFGSRGRLAMRFEREGPSKLDKADPRCKGAPSTERKGSFVGQLRFEGEGGYTHIETTRAKGSVFAIPRRVCKREGRRKTDRGRPRVDVTSLGATSSAPSAPRYAVYKEKPRKPVRNSWVIEEAVHTAFVTEKVPGMAITRQATALSPPSTFAVSPLGAKPVTATVAPPAPFSGTATYEKQADGTGLWSGDLSVELPGRGVIPLVDSTYRARFCRSYACFCPGETCGLIVIVSGREQPERLRRLATRVQP